MNIRMIDEDVIEEYEDQVDCDVAENMGRMYYRGMACHDEGDDSLLSLLIWKLKIIDDSEDTESELKCIYAADPSDIYPLLEGYHKEALNDKVVKTFFESTDREEDKEKALNECGFSIKETESRDIYVTVEDCAFLPVAKKSVPPYIKSISTLDDTEFYQGIMNILFKYDDPALEDLAYLPKEWYEESVSCAAITDGRVNGFLLLHKCPSGVFVPVLYFAVGADNKMLLIEMLRFSINRAAKKYPGDTLIRIHRRNDAVKALSGKLFPDKKGEIAVAGERMEES